MGGHEARAARQRAAELLRTIVWPRGVDVRVDPHSQVMRACDGTVFVEAVVELPPETEPRPRGKERA